MVELIFLLYEITLHRGHAHKLMIYIYQKDRRTAKQTKWLINWLTDDLSPVWLTKSTLTGLTLSSKGIPLLCTAWNCSWLNSVAILSRIWPANKGLYIERWTLCQTQRQFIFRLIPMGLSACHFLPADFQRAGFLGVLWVEDLLNLFHWTHHLN